MLLFYKFELSKIYEKKKIIFGFVIATYKKNSSISLKIFKTRSLIFNIYS